jgi:hypothetical protein
MIRSVLRPVALFTLIAVACWNLGAFTTEVLKRPSREVSNVVNWEKAWKPIHTQLNIAGYEIGELGYVTARSLRGEPPSEDEINRRIELGYVVIPWHLVHNKIDAAFIVADFSVEKPAQLPPGLTPFYDPGLLLLKSTRKQ